MTRLLFSFSLPRLYNISPSLSSYYRPEDSDDIAFICSTNRENGMLRCSDVPPRKVGGAYCMLNAHNATGPATLAPTHRGCVNWNAYYSTCRASDHNPHNGAINFDNIGYAWIAIFQVFYSFTCWYFSEQVSLFSLCIKGLTRWTLLCESVRERFAS